MHIIAHNIFKWKTDSNLVVFSILLHISILNGRAKVAIFVIIVNGCHVICLKKWSMTCSSYVIGYLLVILLVIISTSTQIKIESTFSKTHKVGNNVYSCARLYA